MPRGSYGPSLNSFEYFNTSRAIIFLPLFFCYCHTLEYASFDAKILQMSSSGNGANKIGSLGPP